MSDAAASWIEERISQLLSMRTYSGGESLHSITERLGVDIESLVKLNSNENFFIPKEFISSKMREVSEELDARIYPQFETEELTERLAKYLSLPSEQVLIGNGSDQLLEIITRIFLKGGKDAIATSPTFTMYRVLSALEGGRYIQVPLREDFSLDVDQMLRAATSETTVSFVCSPNNPTGPQFTRDIIEDYTGRFDGIVVLDEAYADFSDYQMYRESGDFPNLIVIRTFSKLFGLAGLRLGYTVSNPRLARVLGRMQQPYAVSTFTLRLALKMLDSLDVVSEGLCRMRDERTRLLRDLERVEGVTPFKSDANFIMFQVEKSGGYVLEELIKRGVVVRNIGSVLGRANCLRTTVGLPRMNDLLISALEDVMMPAGRCEGV